MCCNSKRTAYLSASARAVSTPPPVSPGVPNWPPLTGVAGPNPARTAALSGPGSSLSVTLYYLQTSAIRVRGPVTGRPYDFSEAQPAQVVECRDAATLMRTGLFRRG